ncbi:hypothetical protein [Flavobacterium sp.]|uniref:hypothetical protein n=1 Tax=Flavobacterium sp. TaxID=239 RepID=UPI00374CEC98
MRSSKLNYGDPKSLENKRLDEIKKLSYLERLERLFAILEVTYMLKTAKKVQFKTK